MDHIRTKEDGYVSLGDTDKIAQASSAEWLESEAAVRLLADMAIVLVNRPLVYQDDAGNTWAHPWVFTAYAQWLCPAVAMQVISWGLDYGSIECFADFIACYKEDRNKFLDGLDGA